MGQKLATQKANEAGGAAQNDENATRGVGAAAEPVPESGSGVAEEGTNFLKLFYYKHTRGQQVEGQQIGSGKDAFEKLIAEDYNDVQAMYLLLDEDV